jgi:hypothetical protein
MGDPILQEWVVSAESGKRIESSQIASWKMIDKEGAQMISGEKPDLKRSGQFRYTLDTVETMYEQI